MARYPFTCGSFVLVAALCFTTAAAAQDRTDQALHAIIEGSDKSAEERLRGYSDLLWRWRMEQYPEFATYVGYAGQNDRWTDLSLESIRNREAQTRRFLEVLESIDRGELSERARLDYDLLLRSLRNDVEAQRFDGEYLVIGPMGGVHRGVSQRIGMMPASKVEDYEDIIARLLRAPTLIHQNVTLLEEGLERGVTPPQVTLRDVPQGIQNLLPDDVSESPLLEPFQNFPKSIPEAEQERLRSEAIAVVKEDVYPAYQSLYGYLVKTYIPRARTSIGLSELPEGEPWYAHSVRQYTTTDLTPEQIHETGLREVERIRAEMESVMRETGFDGDLSEFFEFLRTDPQFFFDDPEELLQAYRDIAKRADPELVKLFGTLPRQPYGVKAVPAYAEKSQTTAYYLPGSLEAGRPAYFYANTYDLKSRPKWEMEALTLHEAVPGHHLQIALAQERTGVHDLLKYQFYTAFVEGWGLYSESLGEEMGFYQDPYSRFGQLTYEMWRAIRLVVDTGMHAFGWSRQEAIDYFLANAGKSEHDITVEVDRYIVIPGQALAYKVGELKIKELRAYAEEELGAAFDIRAFHDALLGSGAVPLDVLEANVETWVAERK